MTTTTTKTVNPVAVAAYLIKWDEDPDGTTFFKEVGGIAENPLYEAGVQAIPDSLRETMQSPTGLTFDDLPMEIQVQVGHHVAITNLASAIKRRDKQAIWLHMGVLHAFIGKPLHFLVEFKINEDGNHDPESVQIGTNDYETIEEAYTGYSKELTRIRSEIHEKLEVYSEKSTGLPDFDALFAQRPDLFQLRYQSWARTPHQKP